jgi:hypothetical protein
MRMLTTRGSRLVAAIITGVVLAAGIGAPAYAAPSATPAQVAATLTAVTPGMARVIVAISGGDYEAAVYDKAGHIDFWKYSGSKWAEVGRSSYPRIQQGPTTTTLETVVGRQLTGMADATFITTGGFTGDSTGNALAFGRGPRGWGTIALEPGNVLVPTGNGSTNNDTPGIFFNEDFFGGQLETIVENSHSSTATGPSSLLSHTGLGTTPRRTSSTPGTTCSCPIASLRRPTRQRLRRARRRRSTGPIRSLSKLVRPCPLTPNSACRWWSTPPPPSVWARRPALLRCCRRICRSSWTPPLRRTRPTFGSPPRPGS